MSTIAPVMPSSALPQLAYIDTLRGLAIIGVVAVHCALAVMPANDFLHSLMDLGRRGVQLFYVTSALTLCLSWQQRSRQESSPVRNFYIRRLFRIAPLFYLALVGYLLLHGTAATYWAPQGIGWQHVILPALFLHGFAPDTINAPVPGSWSIAVEMSFYLAFPLLMSLATTARKTLWLLLVSTGIYYLVRALVLLAYGGSSTTPAYLVSEFVELNIASQLPVFCCGMLVFHLLKMELPNKELALIGSMTFMVLMIFFLFPVTTLPHHIFSGALFANLALLLARWPTMLLVNPLTRLLGKLSFGIYLVHFAMLTLLEQLGFTQWSGHATPAVLLFFTVVLGLSALAAAALHYSIELPAIGLGSRAIDRIAQLSASSHR